MAFTVEGRYDLERKDDLRFVKYLVYINELVNGEFKRKEVSYHPCTDKDYEQFYSIEKNSESLFENIQSDEKRGFYCIDWTKEEMVIFGSQNSDNFQKIEVVLVPCNMSYKKLKGIDEVEMPEKCILD